MKQHIDDMSDAELTAYVGQDIPALLAARTEQHPDKTFLSWEPFDDSPQHWSYRAFSERVEQCAAGLHTRGVTLGDKVLLHMDNCPEFLFAWFACARLGAVAVSTNTRSVARDISYFVEKAEAVCALTQARYCDLIRKATSDLRFIAVTGETTDSGFLPFDALFSDNETAPERACDPRADLGIQFTSGTTSRPKAVLWTHANAVQGARLNALHYRVQPDDVSLAFLPLFHTNAQSYSLLTTLQAGGTLVVQPKFSASRFWEVSLRNGCTWTSMIPFTVKAILDQPVPSDSRYRFWSFGIQHADVAALFGVDVVGLWGMTETISAGIIGDSPGPDLNIGRVSPGFEIEIRNTSGSFIQPGETGELFIRGTRGVKLFKEYYKDPEATAKSFDEDGWFETGDLVKMDADGLLYFQDRAKDMLRVGAENVAASEIETVILETGIIEECAVVGQKHHMLDEVPVAFVIPVPDAEGDVVTTVIEACSAKLADFKVVKHVHIVDELPRSTLNKIAKNELRARLPEITA